MADQPKIIRILHSTGANCSDYQTCANKVLGLQSVDVAVRGKPDIAYNFLIGGDGNVYIGRGEDVAIDERPGFLDIAYVGNYLAPYDKMTDKMNEAGKRLITRLLEKGKIARDYVVVPENQTRTTTSPGENVYKNIVKWPHYGWNAQPALNFTRLPGPVKMVRIMHTGGTNCSTQEQCASKVKKLQGWMIGAKGMPDLQYNYMIGGDGNVYIGRGPEVMNQMRNDSMDIGYIGNFLGPYDKMTNKMDLAGRRLVQKLRNEGYLTPDYVVVAQNQTIDTLSPGSNIFEKIKLWPHYNDGLFYNRFIE